MVGWLILLVFLLFGSAFFSGIETAFTSISRFRVKHLVSKNVKNSHLLYKLKNKTANVLTTILIGNNLVNILAASVATFLALKISKEYGVSLATGIMTLMILIFGEITPKNYCAVNAEKVMLKTIKVISFFTILFYPLVKILQLVTKVIIGKNIIFRKAIFTEEELKTVIKLGEEEGTIDPDEKIMIHNILDLDKTRVKEVLTPRVDMFVLNCNEKINSTINGIIEKGFSRIPVYDKKVDNIKGIIFVKDLLPYILESKLDLKLKNVMRPTIFVPENMDLSTLLTTFQTENLHISMVVNEYGGIEGLVTIEDVLEELVGEIYDETDQPERLIREVRPGVYKLLAKISIDDLNERLGFSVEKTDAYDTISGLVLEQMAKIPDEGEILEFDEFNIKVLKVKDNRIKEIELTRKENPPKKGLSEI